MVSQVCLILLGLLSHVFGLLCLCGLVRVLVLLCPGFFSFFLYLVGTGVVFSCLRSLMRSFILYCDMFFFLIVFMFFLFF